ncbi:MAG: response regulator [Synergistaceae bacterium]|nr:response regulator [Synergistaceae bacterium]
MPGNDCLNNYTLDDEELERMETSRLLETAKLLARENRELRRRADAPPDLSEQRYSDLLRAEKYMKLLLESSPEIILLLSPDGRIAYCTNTLLKLTNFRFENIEGRRVEELYSQIGDEEFIKDGLERFKAVQEGHSTIANDVFIDFSGKGESRMYTVQSSPMLGENGNLDGVLVMYYDTTDVRNAEADESARLMLDATPLACSIWDEEDNLLDCNEEALRMFGLSQKSDYLKYFYDLSPEFQEDGLPSREKAEAMDNMVLEIGYLRFEWMHRTLQGADLPVETTLVRIPWNDGYRLATYSRDLREEKENEKRMREADMRNRELEVKNRAALVASEAKSKFLASMSHEIRTPMNAIIGMSDLMRTDNLDSTQQSYFNDIKKMSKALLQINNDILDFSKIEAGKMELIEVHFNLLEVFHNICSMSRFLAETKDLEFRCSFGEDVPHVVFGDDARIRQIIVNIINNAIKYTREGYVDFSLRRVSRSGKDYIACAVKDTGIGIERENFPKLFDAFAQFDGAYNRGIVGTGLGLPITKNLVNLMHGEIEIESEYGIGSTFTVLLPLVEGDPEKIENVCLISFSVATDGVNVLVVDDHQINLKVAVAYLAKHNIRADTALSGREAIEKVSRKRYDLIFMDHMMPEMDGIEATKRIRELGTVCHGDCENVPIVALTANAVAGAKESFLEGGMNDFLPKPIDPRKLDAILIKWLPPNAITCPLEQRDEPESDEAIKSTGVIDRKEGIRNSAGDEALYRELLMNFMSDHASDNMKIDSALKERDRKTAHRIAHTLKSTAGLIGAHRLRDAAYVIEKELAAGDVDPSYDEMLEMTSALESVKTELNVSAAINPVKPKPAGQEPEHLDKGRATELIERLKPLLKSGNTQSLELIDDITKDLSLLGEGAETLVKRMQDFDFDGALDSLTEMEQVLSH